MTTWKARRSGERLLCGKVHPLTGRFLCQGVITPLLPTTLPDVWLPNLPAGLTWGFDKVVRDRARARGMTGNDRPARLKPRYGFIKDGVGARYVRDDTPPRIGARPVPPWWRECPHCNELNEVTIEVLGVL